MKVLLYVSVVLAVIQVTGAKVLAKYSCQDPDKATVGDEFIQFTLTQSGVPEYTRIFLDNRHHEECVATSPNTLSLDLDVEDGPNESGCKVTLPADGILIARVVATKHAKTLQMTDIVYRIMCDFNSNDTQEVTSEPVKVSGSLTDGLAFIAQESVTLELTNPAGTPINTCIIGEQVKLRLALTKSASARQVRAVACTVRDTNQDTMYLVKDSCAVEDELFEYGLPPKSGFGFNVTGTDTSDLVYTTSSGTFGCFVFNTDSVFVVFSCTVAFCADENDAHCSTNNCVHRHKRQSSTNQNTGTTVQVRSPRQIANEAKIAAFTKNRDGKTCNGTQSDVMVGVLMGVFPALFILFVILTFIICCKCVVDSRHSSRGSEASYQTRSHYTQDGNNPSYAGASKRYPHYSYDNKTSQMAEMRY